MSVSLPKGRQDVILDSINEGVFTGHVGPKAFATLQAGEVMVCTGASGTVAEAIEQFKAGGLKMAESANVEGRWE